MGREGEEYVLDGTGWHGNFEVRILNGTGWDGKNVDNIFLSGRDGKVVLMSDFLTGRDGTG